MQAAGFGFVGMAAAALCGFVPVLHVELGAIGLAALTGILYNNAVRMALFVILTGVAL